jgi:hypothetical protein
MYYGSTHILSKNETLLLSNGIKNFKKPLVNLIVRQIKDPVIEVHCDQGIQTIGDFHHFFLLNDDGELAALEEESREVSALLQIRIWLRYR